MDEGAIFHAFRPDDEVELLDVDHARAVVTFRSTSTGLREVLPYPGLTVSRSTLHPGRILPVRFGTVSTDEARHSRERRVARGARKVSAMAHLAPAVTPLALAVLRWTLGDDACARHLGRFTANASTDQDRAVYHHDGGRREVRLHISGGCIRAETDLGGACTMVQGVALEIALPELVVSAMPGRDMREVVDHPALAGTILHATLPTGGGTIIRLRPETIPVADAIASIPRLALAA